MGRIKKLECVKKVLNIQEKRNKLIPNGVFCYEDITPEIRMWCPYSDGKWCLLMDKPKDDVDYFKICYMENKSLCGK